MSSENSGKTARKKRGKPFAKGRSGNPHGRKPIPEDIKAARVIARDDMLRTVIEVRMMTAADIKELNLEELPLGKRAILSAYAKNDYKGIRDYEDRLFGKPQESVSITGDNGSPLIPAKVEFVVVDTNANTDSATVRTDNNPGEV